MSAKKISIKTRIDEKKSDILNLICESENKNISEKVREMIEQLCNLYQETTEKYNVEVTVGDLYGGGKEFHDEYEITINVERINQSEIEDNINVTFVLPEFKVNAIEKYRVDSFCTHRESKNKTISDQGRIMGANIVDGLWRGAIFLYAIEDIDDPQQCFEKVKDKLKQKVILSLMQLEESCI